MTDAATFQPHLNTIFRVDAAPGEVRLQLVGITDDGRAGGMKQFSLFFHGPADRLLPQGTYDLRHQDLGALLLFIVPVMGSSDERIVYQACFSVPA